MLLSITTLPVQSVIAIDMDVRLPSIAQLRNYDLICANGYEFNPAGKHARKKKPPV